jgi:Zn-dependent metalloprotease
LDSISGPATAKSPRIAKTADGYVRFLGSPSADHGFPVTGVRRDDPEAVARRFLTDWADVIVNPSPEVRFDVVRTRAKESRSFVRLQQKYRDLQVFGAQMTVQVDSSGRVSCVLSDVMRDTSVLDSRTLTLAPTITREEAGQRAIQLFSDVAREDALTSFAASSPELMIYEPPVLGLAGRTRLVWVTTVRDSVGQSIGERVLVDAHSGTVCLRVPVIHRALSRNIYDAHDTSNLTSRTFERSDNVDPPGPNPTPTPPAAVNLAWDLADETHEFFTINGGRDSYDDDGGTITMTVRYGYLSWEREDAWWDTETEEIVMGSYVLWDDVLGHEFTHGVTQHMSNLIYANESGAINESFSDMWGEWIDLSYDHDGMRETTEYRWQLGEDVHTWAGGEPFRDMADPPSLEDDRDIPYPDRYEHPDYWHPLAPTPLPSNDYGGVHTNSSVGNKLCYLLTDGDSFNGYTVAGMGISDTAALFYEVQELLTSGADYHDLYSTLMQAAVNLYYLAEDEINLEKACQAVNIRNGTGEGVIIKNTSGDPVAVFEDTGRLALKDSLTTGVSSITPGADAFVVKDGSTVVAYIDTTSGENGGKMEIKGSLSENTIPGESADNIFVVRYEEGSAVAVIDKNGNLKLWGDLSENDSELQ